MNGLENARNTSQLVEKIKSYEKANDLWVDNLNSFSPEQQRDTAKTLVNKLRMWNKQSNPDAKPVAPIAVNSAIVYWDNKMDEYVNPLEDWNDSTVDEKWNNVITWGKSIDWKKIS